MVTREEFDALLDAEYWHSDQQHTKREEVWAKIAAQQELTERYKDLLKQIAYPRRGTEEERMDIYDAAKLIQSNFTVDELREQGQ